MENRNGFLKNDRRTLRFYLDSVVQKWKQKGELAVGSWFSNVQIRRNGHVTENDVADCIKRYMEGKAYRLIDSQEEADAVVTILWYDHSQWISVCADVLAHDDPESCMRIASPLSAELRTDVMGISCFDSDYLYLNLVNAEEQTDAWLGIGQGKAVGITRRNNVTAWKKKVSDYPAFSAKAKTKYLLADEFLHEAELYLSLPVTQSTCAAEDVQDMGPDTNVISLCFRQEGDGQDSERVRLAHYNFGLPCFMDQESSVTAINVGAESKGISVYFIGPYVEHEEIVFSDVRFGRRENAASVELTKVRLKDGQWAYCYHDPEYPIPPKVPARMKKEKRHRLESERWFSVWFTPHGNPRKTLDITVVFVPDAHPEGQTGWNVWKPKGSKEAFIDHYNKIWKRVRAIEDDPDQCLPFLREEDFD